MSKRHTATLTIADRDLKTLTRYFTEIARDPEGVKPLTPDAMVMVAFLRGRDAMLQNLHEADSLKT